MSILRVTNNGIQQRDKKKAPKKQKSPKKSPPKAKKPKNKKIAKKADQKSQKSYFALF